MDKTDVDSVRDRAVMLMEGLSVSYGRYKWLEDHTGVPAQKWANLYNKRQQLTVEMMTGLAKLAPEKLEWLLLGDIYSGIQIHPDDKFGNIMHMIWNVEISAELKKRAESDWSTLEKELFDKSKIIGKDEVEKMVNKIFK